MEHRERLPLWATHYLQRLGLEERPASYSYLAELCQAHLQTMPFENVSKLLWYRDGNTNSIPSVETYVVNAVQHDSGGTCYTSNSSLQRLLQELGFSCHLVALEPDHMGIVVAIPEWNGEKVYADVGAAAPLFEPVRFQTDPDNCAVFGIEQVRIAPDQERLGRFRFVRDRRGGPGQ
jgi:N-hydroxyarylamine O-acetyltransferase